MRDDRDLIGVFLGLHPKAARHGTSAFAPEIGCLQGVLDSGKTVENF
jgi:hypothetical protein